MTSPPPRGGGRKAGVLLTKGGAPGLSLSAPCPSTRCPLPSPTSRGFPMAALGTQPEADPGTQQAAPVVARPTSL